MTDRFVRKAVRYYVAPGAVIAFLAVGCFGGTLLIGLLSLLNWIVRHDLLTWLARELAR